MKKQENPKCDPCEQRFEQNVEKMVHEVEGHTPQVRQKKEKEVEAAFSTPHPAHQGHKR